jgi:hypothetical protein
MPKQFWLPKRYATVKRLVADNDSPGVQETALRVYRSDPDGITVQWRVKAKDGKVGAGTITHGTLTLEEARALARFILTDCGTLSDIDELQRAFEVGEAA